MALVQKKISKGKQLRLAAALALVIVTTVLVAYYGLLRQPSAGVSVAPSASPAAGEKAFVPAGQTGFEAAAELSKTAPFRLLRSFGVWPLSTEPKGRSQPFILKAAPREQEE